MPRSAPLRLAATATLLLAAGAARADTMPQLDFGNPLLHAQVIWGAIIFAGFYAAVSLVGLPGVGAILAQREQTIGDDLEQARLAKAKADRAVADLNEARRRAYAESQAAVNAAVQKAKEDAAQRTAALNEKLDRQLKDSEARIDAARSQALGSIRAIATETTSAVIGRVTGRAADPGRVQAAVSTLLAERGLAGS
jgi:F-type H+-transporting ATPase subunit b